MKIERKDFRIKCQYADEDGTEHDMYSLYTIAYDVWEIDGRGDGREFTKEIVDNACKHIAFLMNIYLYCHEDEGLIFFDMGNVGMSSSDVDENTDERYKYYFEVQALLNSDNEKIIAIKEFLTFLEIPLGDYYILFLYTLFGGKLESNIF